VSRLPETIRSRPSDVGIGHDSKVSRVRQHSRGSDLQPRVRADLEEELAPTVSCVTLESFEVLGVMHRETARFKDTGGWGPPQRLIQPGREGGEPSRLRITPAALDAVAVFAAGTQHVRSTTGTPGR
jgi:hypothetical protein